MYAPRGMAAPQFLYPKTAYEDVYEDREKNREKKTAPYLKGRRGGVYVISIPHNQYTT